LPPAKNYTEQYKAYVGEYTDTSGKKLVISQENNRLNYVWNNRDLKNFFTLPKNADDYFSAFPLQIFFIRNEKGEVVKALCRDVGNIFWVNKIK
jgi:hypothetical protein